LEHDKNFGAWHQKWHHAPIFFIMLQIFLSCSQFFHRKRLKMREPDKKNWSMIYILEHDIKNYIMLQIFLSCSQIFHRKRTKRWEHDKKNWSMIKIWEHDIKNDIMLQIFLSCSKLFYHAPSFFTENVWKCGSMI
jgi:hypothetical protein